MGVKFFASALIALAVISFVPAVAQTGLNMPVDIARAYQKGTRAHNGKPGPKYWQNTANYNIKVNFDPKTRLIKGTVDIDYTNNSPDTLTQILFKLYPNYYQKGAVRARPVQPADLTDGVNIAKVVVNDVEKPKKRIRTLGTNMSVPDTVMPGQKVNCKISYSYTLNKTSHNRTGQVDDGAFFIAYFFPRIAVYDDIDGWNTHPYLGSQEFYNDFCRFDAEVTVPGAYLVWATGDLVNPTQVLQPKYIKRMVDAGNNDSVTDVITEAEAKAGKITTPGRNHTWRFVADDVTDFVFATSNHYMWKASSLAVDPKSGRRTRVDAVFNPEHKDYYEVVNYARKTVEAMSYRFPKWPFPYPHETVFDGLDQMEYPMMVNDNPLPDAADAIELTDHEIFHTMFPFYMGINETKYAWMDEGWATIGEWLVSPMIDPKIVDLYGVERTEQTAGTEEDQPIMTLTTQTAGASEFTNAYPKPAMAYLYLKDMLGDELFTKALHHYISNWHGKHPGPYDFFNSINAGAGRDLNWFWQRWFFDRGVADLAIDKVTADKANYSVTIRSVGNKPVPVDLLVEYTDGTNKTIHHDMSAWERSNTFLLNFKAEKPVKQLILGSMYVTDANRADNVHVIAK
ncbi:M1 family metallopeptidase [Mucilaginibacter myungsuensis]|uniref:M1 family metallopeptidase n=1 Tax=Mucilaginibacter myungsuensis TaxID=649104 RepID=A0A929KYS8_9SPHI|nr:M1 family metallopeptidase [Mucilaginibacter myungsuensis]MBE9664179.1 M1 family metallopeptidase [Mucilaginibacter myungsuensis]MDN3599882.1 M1 family metallopeptidase [Mucilaginibacter myungsuensis]